MGKAGSLFALVLLILVLGFVFGQAIHSVSGFIESTVYIGLRDYYSFLTNIKHRLFGSETKKPSGEFAELTRFQILRLILLPIVPIVATIITGNLSFVLGFLSGTIVGIVGPLNRLRKGARAVLTPHRDLFFERMAQNDDLANAFNERISDSYTSVSGESEDENYLLALSRLEFEGSGRARLFQAIFSFSRSLWIILLFFSVIFALIGWNISPSSYAPSTVNKGLVAISTYKPAISGVVGDGSGMVLTSVILVIISFLFVRSEAKYKNLYVEYLIADYLTIVNTE